MFIIRDSGLKIKEKLNYEQINGTGKQDTYRVALDIDEDGMTTARKLYTFLELAQGQFSRWVKSNIVDNEFATESRDYWRFDIDVETPTGGDMKRDDYKLTAHFAKETSMKEQRESRRSAWYFTHLEGTCETESH